MTANPQHPGARIKERREALGLSREILAGQAGISLRTLERIEACGVEPRRATLAVIEFALTAEADGAAA